MKRAKEKGSPQYMVARFGADYKVRLALCVTSMHNGCSSE